MRAQSASAFEFLRLGWLRAGFGSFAYRLAHLRAARPAVLGTLCLCFFLAWSRSRARLLLGHAEPTQPSSFVWPCSGPAAVVAGL